MGAATIPLMVQQPKIESPIQSIGQLMQLKSGMAEIAVRQAQAEQGRQHSLELQAQTEQRNRDLQDSNFLQQAAGDPEIGPKIAAGDITALRGKVQPKTLDALQMNLNKIHQEKATATTTDLANSNTALARLGESLSGITQTFGDDVAKINEVLPGTLASLDAQGVFKAAGIDPSQLPKSITSIDDLKKWEAHLGVAQAINDKALAIKTKQQELDQKTAAESRAAADFAVEHPAKVAKAETEAAVSQATLANPALLTPELQQSANQDKITEDESRRHNAELERHGILQLGIDREKLKLEQQKAGFEMGGGISETAKMAAAGQMDPQTLRAAIRRSPGLLQQIRAIDPNFDEANIDSRYNTLKEFTSTSTGKAGGQAIALNTLIHHADLYLDAADALKNGTFTPGNAVYNKVASLFGSAPPNNAALVARFLAGETGKVATGGVPAEGEIKGILSSLGTNASPEQMKEAGAKLLQIAAGRATPLMERVKQDKLENVIHILGPDAQEILSRRGFDPATMKPKSALAAGSHRIQIGTKLYDYKGSGDTADLNNYTEVK